MSDEARLGRIRAALNGWSFISSDDARWLVETLDATDHMLHVLLTDPDAAHIARGQGAAEERARIEEVILTAWEWMRVYDGRRPEANDARDAAMKHVLGNIGQTEDPSLLPPAAARAECDRLRRENERMREALRNCADLSQYAESSSRICKIANKALEATP